MLRPAQYLLRFDDLCPAMPRQSWERFLPLIAQYGVKPILGIVPDNQDPNLNLAPPDPNFWAEMRALQQAGAAIALHGYRHLCLSENSGLLGLHPYTEFAGVPRETQRAWIREGMKMLRSHALEPTLWIAPRHGFDRATLDVLRDEGIHVLSDGFARMPYVRHSVTWIPQQLWRPIAKQSGLWTLCIHPGTADDALIAELDAFLQSHAAQFTSVDHLLATCSPARPPWRERLYEQAALWRVRRRLRKRSALASR